MLAAVKEYLAGRASQKVIAARLGIDRVSVRRWIRKYESMGPEIFEETGCRCYSAELKEEAVNAYLSGQGSLPYICKIYKIKSTRQLRNWIKKYNGHERLTTSRQGRIKNMTKGRKTTFEERVEIARYCISQGCDYSGTALKYGISYQQARNYTVKYQSKGPDALQDRRGRTKPEEEMSEIERLRAENRLLRAQKESAEMEVSFLKKLKEIERRRG